MDELVRKKEKLVEEVGVHFEKISQLPPLAARIYAWLILCSKSGHSFDEIVCLSKASKSSVSTNLNLLLQSGCIEYFTKSGERKRYFRLSKRYLKVTLQQHEEKTVEELAIISKVDSFNKKYNTPKYKKHQEVSDLYFNYLKSHRKNLGKTIRRMDELEKTL